MKNTKKAFTLVELLVVIAILAVLASVSIIGYTAFTKKAVQNNALNELAQAKTLVVAEATEKDSFVITDGTNDYTFKLNSDGVMTIEQNADHDASSKTMKQYFADLANLTGSFSYDATAKTVTYSLTSGTNDGQATWNLTTGNVNN